ncbi:DUF4157 domain-containing protein [Micromonospora sp. NPDC023956]|uniref:eCIS core domain-containing protein n=1 Tax=Micromonospora sp. NPDC023956 TaxID=3155722 RepID=UPI0033DC5171
MDWPFRLTRSRRRPTVAASVPPRAAVTWTSTPVGPDGESTAVAERVVPVVADRGRPPSAVVRPATPDALGWTSVGAPPLTVAPVSAMATLGPGRGAGVAPPAARPAGDPVPAGAVRRATPIPAARPADPPRPTPTVGPTRTARPADPTPTAPRPPSVTAAGHTGTDHDDDRETVPVPTGGPEGTPDRSAYQQNRDGTTARTAAQFAAAGLPTAAVWPPPGFEDVHRAAEITRAADPARTLDTARPPRRDSAARPPGPTDRSPDAGATGPAPTPADGRSVRPVEVVSRRGTPTRAKEKPSGPPPARTSPSDVDPQGTPSVATPGDARPRPLPPYPAPTGPAPAPTGPAPAPTGPAPAPTGTAPTPAGPAPTPAGTAPAPSRPAPTPAGTATPAPAEVAPMTGPAPTAGHPALSPARFLTRRTGEPPAPAVPRPAGPTDGPVAPTGTPPPVASPAAVVPEPAVGFPAVVVPGPPVDPPASGRSPGFGPPVPGAPAAGPPAPDVRGVVDRTGRGDEPGSPPLPGPVVPGGSGTAPTSGAPAPGAAGPPARRPETPAGPATGTPAVADPWPVPVPGTGPAPATDEQAGQPVPSGPDGGWPHPPVAGPAGRPPRTPSSPRSTTGTVPVEDRPDRLPTVPLRYRAVDPGPATDPPVAPQESPSPVPAALVDGFRHRYGVDVSGVPVRRDAAATALVRQAGARAATRDGEVLLPADVGPLDAPPARALLAHELTHVVQQHTLGGPAPAEFSDTGRDLEARALAAEYAFGDGSAPAGAGPLAPAVPLLPDGPVSGSPVGAGTARPSGPTGTPVAGAGTTPVPGVGTWGATPDGGLTWRAGPPSGSPPTGQPVQRAPLGGAGDALTDLRELVRAEVARQDGSGPTEPPAGPALDPEVRAALRAELAAATAPPALDRGGGRLAEVRDAVERLRDELRTATDREQATVARLGREAASLRSWLRERLPGRAVDLDSPDDLEELAGRLYGRLRGRLRQELLLDRERGGRLARFP